jgi:hypothetical protein
MMDFDGHPRLGAATTRPVDRRYRTIGIARDVSIRTGLARHDNNVPAAANDSGYNGMTVDG